MAVLVGKIRHPEIVVLSHGCASLFPVLEFFHQSFHAEVGMPRYEFFCHNCKKLFSTVLSLVDYEEGEVLCPQCGSKEVEQRWSAFTVITSKKSA